LPTYITFGDCLKTMLATLDISINRLSKAINVDSSLVNRWIHGKRIPAYNTCYIENISEYLSKNIRNSFQLQHINELCLNVCKDCDSEDSDKKKIMSALLEAQGYSLERKNDEQKENTGQAVSEEQISASIDTGNGIHTCDASDITDSVSLSGNDKIIFGIENIISAGISLLEKVTNLEADQKCEGNKTIYITFNNGLDMISNALDELTLWRELLSKALNNGWHMVFLLRLSNDNNWNQRFISYMLPLIKNRRFHLYYFKRYDSNTANREIFVVPGIGALSCFPSMPPSDARCAFYIENKVGVGILKGYFSILQKTCAKSLIKYYSGENNHDYCYRLMESEESIGGRLLFSCFFNALILPEDLFKKLLKRRNLSNNEFAWELDLYKRRSKAFHANIRYYEYKDIYFADSIIDLVKNRRYCFYSYTGVKMIDMEAEDVSELMRNVVTLLETYENYSIAFISRSPDSSIKKEDFSFWVKERQVVFFETHEPEKSLPEVRLSIDEPMVVSAFNEYFKNIWEEIAPVNKEKSEVIAWLKGQINMLNRKLSWVDIPDFTSFV